MSDKYAVIDMTTGTVLDLNLALVKLPDDEEQIEEILSSDSAAFDYAQTGAPLEALLRSHAEFIFD